MLGVDSRSAAKWRASRFSNFAKELIGDSQLLEPVRKALGTFEGHLERILRRWESLLTNARLEGQNSLFQIARSRGRENRNVKSFITVIYCSGLPSRSCRLRENSTSNVEEPKREDGALQLKSGNEIC